MLTQMNPSLIFHPIFQTRKGLFLWIYSHNFFIFGPSLAIVFIRVCMPPLVISLSACSFVQLYLPLAYFLSLDFKVKGHGPKRHLKHPCLDHIFSFILPLYYFVYMPVGKWCAVLLKQVFRSKVMVMRDVFEHLIPPFESGLAQILRKDCL